MRDIDFVAIIKALLEDIVAFVTKIFNKEVPEFSEKAE